MEAKREEPSRGTDGSDAIEPTPSTRPKSQTRSFKLINTGLGLVGGVGGDVGCGCGSLWALEGAGSACTSPSCIHVARSRSPSRRISGRPPSKFDPRERPAPPPPGLSLFQLAAISRPHTPNTTHSQISSPPHAPTTASPHGGLYCLSTRVDLVCVDRSDRTPANLAVVRSLRPQTSRLHCIPRVH